jgi:hypothetical protein
MERKKTQQAADHDASPDLITDIYIPDDGGTSETSVDNYFTRQYIPEDNSEHLHRKFNW